MILLTVILPVFLIGGAGFVFGRIQRFDAKPLVHIAFYLLSSALIFRSVYTSTASGQSVGQIALFIVLLQGSLFALSRIAGRVFGWDDDTRAAGSLMLTFSNSGNYGLPVLLFAFGEAGFNLGVIYMLASTIMQGTLGASIASWRSGTQVLQGIGRVLRIPWLYVLGLALVVRAVGWTVPAGIYRAVDLLADAAIPLQLVLLGIQLSRISLRSIGREALWLTAMKLLIPPLLGWGLTAALGIGGLLQAVLIVEGSMPSAIISLLLSMNYQRRPELTASVVLLTTAFSLVSLSILLSLLT